MKTSRVSHPARVVVVVVTLVLLLVAAFVIGRFFQPPSQDAVKDAGRTIDVWAPVQMRSVDDRKTFAGTVKPGATQGITIPGVPSPAVIVRQTLTPGGRASQGGLAAVISGKPYFLMRGPLALYRDLKVDDRGDDVVTLQNALLAAGYQTRSDGLVDWSTINAAIQLFASEGFDLPSKELSAKNEKGGSGETKETKEPEREWTIPYQQFLTMPGQGGTVVTAATIGTNVSPSTVIASVRISDPYVEFIADASQAGSIWTGQKLSLRSDKGEVTGSIREIGAFQAGKDGSRSGRPVKVSFPASDGNKLPLNQSVTVTTSIASAGNATTAVPITAIRQDGSNSYVLVQRAGTADQRVNVRVVRTGGGYAAVEGPVTTNDRVKVS